MSDESQVTAENTAQHFEEKGKLNIVYALILGLIALGVGIMPFFYLNGSNL